MESSPPPRGEEKFPPHSPVTPNEAQRKRVRLEKEEQRNEQAFAERRKRGI